MDINVALLSKVSEVGIELVNKVRLSLSDTKDTKKSPLDPTHHYTPTPGSISPYWGLKGFVDRVWVSFFCCLGPLSNL